MVPFNAEILNFDVLNGEPGFNAIVIEGETANPRSIIITTLEKEIPYHLNKTKFVGEFQMSDRRPEAEKRAKNVFFVFEE